MASKMDARLLKSTKFPPEFNKKVDMQKVNVQVMQKWIANKISEILGNEDDVVIELCFNLVEGSRYPDIKSLQIQLTGFLDKDTASFCKGLWNLLLSAQDSPQGVPKELLEAKKMELMQEKRDADKAADDSRRRRDDFDRRDHEVSDMKERDRRDRANNRPGNRFGRDSNRGFDHRDRRGDYRGGQRNDRHSEPRQRDSRDSYGRDIYVPSDRPGRGRDQQRQRRRRSPSGDANSRSRSRDSTVRHSRKRSRSPRPQHRRDEQPGRQDQGRRSRSVSGGASSPKPKRRRASYSRGPGTPRRRRESASTDTRSRSLSRGSATSEGGKLRRRRSVSGGDEGHSDRRHHGGRGRTSDAKERKTGGRRNSSSASSHS